jgi:hypothetical protein
MKSITLRSADFETSTAQTPSRRSARASGFGWHRLKSAAAPYASFAEPCVCEAPGWSGPPT